MAVVATGFFDGVHPGHRLVIETLLSEARARGEQSLVVTFWPHPRAVLQSGADSLRYLTSRAERVEMLKAHRQTVVERMARMQRHLDKVTCKIDYFSGLLRSYEEAGAGNKSTY